MRVLAQARSVLRLLQAASDAVDLVEKALRKEHPRQVAAKQQVKEVSELHILFYEYNGYWPTDRRELIEFSRDMGFDE